MTDQQPLTVGKALVSTYSGVDLTVTPLTFQARAMLQRASEAKYPMPDPKPYEVVSNMRELGSSEPAVIPAENNEEYVAEVERVENLRTRFKNDYVLAISVTHPRQGELVKHYATELAAMRAMSPDEVPEDDWAAVVSMFLASEPERLQLYSVISRLLPLSETEIVNAVKFFRVAARRPRLSNAGDRKSARRIESAESGEAQRTAG